MHAPSALAHLMLALALVVFGARALGALLARVGQPAVVGEVLAGVLLGPTVLGALSPGTMAAAFPRETVTSLAGFGQLGVLLFMLHAGAELDLTPLRARLSTTAALALASMLVPLASGVALGFVLPAPADIPRMQFAGFVGVALSVTAFPVLVRILRAERLERTPLGIQATAVAAADDLVAWLLLAAVVAVARARTEGVVYTVLCLALFFAATVAFVRGPVARLARRHAQPEDVPARDLVVVLLSMLASALATEGLGVHAVFGAFLFGAMIPHDSALGRAIDARLLPLVELLLLPAFFAHVGLSTDLGAAMTGSGLTTTALVVVVAFASKVFGTYGVGRLAGMPHREALALGVLLDTRGLMELVILDVGRSLGLIDDATFASMVVMAIVTTLLTTPLVRALLRRPGGPLSSPPTGAVS